MASHACSVRCCDPCACLCEQTRRDAVSDNLSILDDSPFNPGLHPEVHSLQSELAGNEVFNAAAWQEWEAPSSHGNAPQSMQFFPAKGTIIRDTYRPVELSNGSRKTERLTATILHSPLDISGHGQQLWSQSGPIQQTSNIPKSLVEQFTENVSPEPQAPTTNLGTYAAVAQGPWNLPLPPVPDVPIATSQTRPSVSGMDETDPNASLSRLFSELGTEEDNLICFD